MRQFKWILALLALILLASVSISPFLRDAMPLTDDGNLHVYRSIVLDDAIRNDGSLYPRYTSGLAYGYGASLFNYFPPTSYYPTVIFHAMGLDWVTAWKATVIFYVFLAGIGTFLWARQWLDDTGALIASAAYMYAPYTLFDTVTRGSSNEFAGMALLPFALWGFTRLAHSGRRSDYLVAVFSYVLFIMAHNVMTLYGSLLLIAYCGILLFTSERRVRVFWQLASAGIFAVLITAFFWLPALAETDYVKINGVLENLDFISVTNTLRGIGTVFALPQTADPTQLQSVMPISFNWILVILAIIGFFLPQPPTEEDDSHRSILGLHVLLFVTLIIVIFSQLPQSATFWESVRLLQYSQFAWRPMSIGSLVLALLAGIGGGYFVRLIPTQIGKMTVAALILAGIVLYSVPWLYRPEINLTAETLADAQSYEVVSRQPVLSSYGEYLPVNTDENALNTDRFLEDAPRLSNGDNYEILQLEENSRQLFAQIDVSQATTISVNWLYVPGWRVKVDGQTVPVVPVTDAGLVGFEIEPGIHDIDIHYTQTGTQQLASIISIISLIAVVGIAFFFLSPSPDGYRSQDLQVSMLITAAIVGIGLLALKTQVIDRTDNIFRNSRFENGILENVDIPLNVNFNNGMRLLGADSLSGVASGGTREIHLYWTVADTAINSDYSSIVQMVDYRGIVIAEASNFYPGGLATSNWLPGYYLEDVITLDIPDYTPPGDYDIVVGVFDSATGQRLDVINNIGNPTGIDITTGTLTITHPILFAGTEDLRSPIFTVSGMSLLEIDGLPDTAQVGEEVTFSWLWRVNTPLQGITPTLRWNAEISVPFNETIPGYPFAEWRSGDVWRGYQRFYIPPELIAGEYDILIQAGDANSIVHEMTITVPERNFEQPEFDTDLLINWQNGIQLIGYTQTETGITLHWQTETVINRNLRLFVQVFDENGQILFIDDGIPVNNQRPTTGWIPGEFITSGHQSDAFATDSHIILIGWYDTLTGQRILLSDTGDDALTLPINSETDGE